MEHDLPEKIQEKGGIGMATTFGKKQYDENQKYQQNANLWNILQEESNIFHITNVRIRNSEETKMRVQRNTGGIRQTQFNSTIPGYAVPRRVERITKQHTDV